jgi:hypothetical protein
LQGKIKGPADIQNVLQARWKDLSQNFEKYIERPTTNTDKEKFATYYTTSEMKLGFSFMDYRTTGWIEVARALGPDIKVNYATWTKLSMQSQPIMPTTAESSSHSIYTTVRPVSLHVVAKINDDLFVLALSNHAKSDHNRYMNGWDKNAHRPAHVPRSEAIMKIQALGNSEVLFQQLMQHFNDDAQELAKLSWIWRTEIADSITKWVIIKSHEGIGKSCSCWCKFNARSDDENERKWFQKLVATNNGKVGMRLLADHPDIFDKEITEVYTLPEGSLLGLKHFHTVFRLEKKDTGKLEEMME